MIQYYKGKLKNGLTYIINEDKTTPLVSVNILYDVGSRDENPDRTGFAHLFEHLMFEGSKNVPSFDEALQLAGGENNAFTTNDITNYYCTLPAKNIETAFWIESDRMFLLDINQEKLNVQKNVVIEEFKQRYLNKPYGDSWLLIHPLVYKTHPYRWDTIGKEISHIEQAILSDVTSFYQKHYGPQNAILCISGNISITDAETLIKKWFEDITPNKKYIRNIPKEPPQTEIRKSEVVRDVPSNALYKSYRVCGKNDIKKFYITSLLQDILSYGESSRLYQSLIKDQKIFTSISAISSDTIDDGMLVVKGKVNSDFTIEQAEKALDKELQKLVDEKINEKELVKIKNTIETSNTIQEMLISSKSFSLAYYELLGNIDLINQEKEIIESITINDIQNIAQEVFRESNTSVLYYLKQ